MNVLRPLAFALLIIRPLLAADFTPPPEAIPLEDARMAAYYTDPAHRAVITGSIKNLSAEDRSKLAITCCVGVLNTHGQVSINVPLSTEGLFRVEFEEGFPVRDMWFRIGSNASVSALLTKDLHIELDFSRGKRAPKITYSGTDGELNKIATGFKKLRAQATKRILAVNVWTKFGIRRKSRSSPRQSGRK